MHTTFFTALPQDHPWGNRIHYYETLPSTNALAKELAAAGAPEGTVVIAGQQTDGRGRLGRSFSSPAGLGLYLSVILRPCCKLQKLMHLTCAAGIAACDAIETLTGIRPGIKWANDLVWEKRKLGGILTELGFDESGNVAWTIVGIGINCLHAPEDFPEDIQSIAASLTMAADKSCSPQALTGPLILALEEMRRKLFFPGPTMARYRRDCVTLGREVSVCRGSALRHGVALSVDDLGELIVQYTDGSTEAVSSGEVSIRGMYGYV